MATSALKMSVDVLDWAAREAGESLETLAGAVAKRKADRDRILRGELTTGQAEKVAKLAGVPFGFLFLDEPPKTVRAQIPDLRQRPNPSPLSADFFEVYEDVLNKQEWYLQHLREDGIGQRVEVVGRFSYADRPDPSTVAIDMRSRLKLTPADRANAGSTEGYFSLLSERAENLGILVMKSGIVRSNTRRPLSTDEFLGFALASRAAPIVFVNGRDYMVATVFTLAHELAHIWLGESGVTDTPTTRARGLERLCNQIAAELLVPKAEFLANWKDASSVDLLTARFRVSRWVIAIRALELGKIAQKECDSILSQRFSKRASSGGDPFRTIPVRNSKRFTQELVASAMSGHTLIRHAAALLSVRPDTVVALGGQRPSRSA